MELETIRRERLLELIENQPGPKLRGKQKCLADKVGVTTAYIGQLKTGYRGINEKTARQIEKKLDLPAGWMDGKEPGNSYNDKILVRLVADVEKVVKSDPDWPTERKVHIALMLLEIYEHSGEYPDVKQAVLFAQAGERKAR